MIINKKMLIILIICFASLSLTVTLSYFGLNVIGNPFGYNQVVTGNFNLSYDQNEINITNLAPIKDEDYMNNALVKEFIVTNDSSSTLNSCTELYLNVSQISDELKSPYLKYVITGAGRKAEGDFENITINEDIPIITNVFLTPNQSVKFNIYLWISYDNEVNQLSMLGKSLSIKLIAKGTDVREASKCSSNDSLLTQMLTNNVTLSDEDLDYDITNDGCYRDYNEDVVVCPDGDEDSNGYGLYYTSDLSITEDFDGDDIGEKVYFYRGNIDNNYVIFGKYSNNYNTYVQYDENTGIQGKEDYYSLEDCERSIFDNDSMCVERLIANSNEEMCWKIIRTTEDGGIKLLYWGTANNGVCSTAPESIGNSSFNKNSYNKLFEIDNMFVGYMYSGEGDIVSDTGFVRISSNVNYVFGTSYEYNPNYGFKPSGTLTKGAIGDSSICNSSVCPVANMYTCLSNRESSYCSMLYKIESYRSSNYINVEFITIESTSYSEAHEPLVNSKIKNTIDVWFENNFIEYDYFLNNSIYCNDRTSYIPSTYASASSSFNTSSGGGYGRIATYFGSYLIKSPLVFKCKNTNDQFTLSVENGGDLGRGNNALTYPVGLIEMNELRFAGGVYRIPVGSYHLYLKENYWTMTPAKRGSIVAEGNLGIEAFFLTNSFNVRPVISVNNNSKVLSGNGSISNPYRLTN